MDSPTGKQEMSEGLQILQSAKEIDDLIEVCNKDRNGSLDPLELYPVILNLTAAHRYALDIDQCTKFTAVFDDEKTGVISKTAFVEFARFFIVMSFLKTEDGKKTLAAAAAGPLEAAAAKEESSGRRKQAKNKREEAISSNRKQSMESQAMDAGHMAVDLEFYQARAEKLSLENNSLRAEMFDMREMMRRMESRMDEQEQRLVHAEIDLKSYGLQLR